LVTVNIRDEDKKKGSREKGVKVKDVGKGEKTNPIQSTRSSAYTLNVTSSKTLM